nr:N-acetyl-gamma-glutamyl-phosphate reductase [Desulfobulbaceae bacterium]
MTRVGIIGASGYTGVELARLLSRHGNVELTVATSRQYAGKKLSDVYPSLAGCTDLICENSTGADLAAKADVFFTAVPHQTAMNIIPGLLEAGKKVVDLSADFRLHDSQVYEQWYQVHCAVEYLAEAVYGLPEIHRHAIPGSRLIANPGCYPTSTILGLAPLLKNKLVDVKTIIVDSKSGTSGAGRSAQVGTLYCEVTDGFRAYKVASHRHTPEIEQELSELAGQEIVISFTPHLVPMSRGILTTIYATVTSDLTNEKLQALYTDFYAGERFVRICPRGSFPATQYVRGSNFCDIAPTYDPRTGRVIIVSAIDNLVKGAAGQAVQNMNIMCGFDEASGLEAVPLFP